jgi:hypothetical protein
MVHSQSHVFEKSSVQNVTDVFMYVECILVLDVEIRFTDIPSALSQNTQQIIPAHYDITPCAHVLRMVYIRFLANCYIKRFEFVGNTLHTLRCSCIALLNA